MRFLRAIGVILGCAASAGTLCVAEPPKGAAAHVDQPAALDAGTKAAFDAAADYSTKYSGRAVLVMRDGKIIYERYDNGWKADRVHPLASGTKSFTGVVAAAAVQDGLITWDEVASDTITEWKGDPRKSKITVRQLLSLSSGLDPADAQLSTGGGGRLLGQGATDRAKRLGTENAPRPKDFFATAIGVDAKHEPGERFEYGPSHFFAFGAMLERKIKARHAKTPSFPYDSYDAYMRGRIMEPLGITYLIGRDAEGHPNMPGGALLTAREWSKFGQFVLQKGEWATASGEVKSVVSWDTLSECFKPSKTNSAYGLTWWLKTDAEATLLADTGGGAGAAAGGGKGGGAGGRPNRMELLQKLKALRGKKHEDVKLDVYMAAGLGKQRLYVIPEHKLVVVRFAEATREGRRFEDADFLRPIVTGKAPGTEGAKGE